MNKKQSLFHIAKRDSLPWYKAALIRGGAIVLALIVCAIVTTLLTGENPIKVYSTILYGAFGTSRTRVQDALLEHRRRGSGAHRLPCHRRLHDLPGR